MAAYEDTLVKAVWLMIHIDGRTGGTNKVELAVLDQLRSIESIPESVYAEAIRSAESILDGGLSALKDHVLEGLAGERYGRKCRAVSWMKRAALAYKGVNHDEEALLDAVRSKFSIDWGDVTDYDAMIANAVGGQKR